MSVNAGGLSSCSKRECLSGRPCSQDANHLSHPVGLREDDPSGHRLHLLRIACHIQDGQIRKALAVGPGHRPAIGPRQANVSQQGIEGNPACRSSRACPPLAASMTSNPVSFNPATAISRTNGSSSTTRTFIRSALAQVPPVWRSFAKTALDAIQFQKCASAKSWPSFWLEGEPGALGSPTFQFAMSSLRENQPDSDRSPDGQAVKSVLDDLGDVRIDA